MGDGSTCGGEYDSHAWDWIDGHYVCPDCGLLDLTGDRIMAAIADALQVPAAALRPARG